MHFLAANSLSLGMGVSYLGGFINPPDGLAPLMPTDCYRLSAHSGHNDSGGGSNPGPTLTQLDRDHYQIQLKTHRTLRWLSSVMTVGSLPVGMVSGVYFHSPALLALLALPTVATTIWLSIDLLVISGTEQRALKQFQRNLPQLALFNYEIDRFCQDFDARFALSHLFQSPVAIQALRNYKGYQEGLLKDAKRIISAGALQGALRNPLTPLIRWFTDDRVPWLLGRELRALGEQWPEAADPTYTLQRSLLRAEAFVAAIDEILLEEDE